MARKPSLSVEKLSELGAERLALLVLDEAGRSAPFRKLVNAALAATKGPEAVAKLIDRRLAALERARSFIEWEKVRAFEADLAATVATVVGELAPASPAMAVDRLLRFVATHEDVFDRVDDSSGRVQDVYKTAIEATGELTARLTAREKGQLPERVMAALGESTHGYLTSLGRTITPHLDKETLRRWDRDLAARQKTFERAAENDWQRRGQASQMRSVRQSIAEALGDLDSLIALEMTKHPNSQDAVGIAARLLDAGRLDEALVWVRKAARPAIRYGSIDDFVDEDVLNDPTLQKRWAVEARILEAQGDKPAAQKLRWATFETTLNADALRAYLDRLPDFGEFEALDRAFQFAFASKQHYPALHFFLEWPHLDLAAKFVLDNRRTWEGRLYHFLAPAAETLEHEQPAAATVLYRALLDDILARARSNAYAAGARHLARLDALASQADASLRLAGIDGHATYRASLVKNHGRKAGFWAAAPKA